MFRYAVTDQIPQYLLEEYNRATSAGSERLYNIKKSKWKMVVSDRADIIGFVSGSPVEDFVGSFLRMRGISEQEIKSVTNYFRVTGIYVNPVYHRRGIGRALISRAIRAADRFGFSTLQVSDMAGPLHKWMLKEKQRVAKSRTKSVRVYPAGIGFTGEITWKHKKL